MKVEQHREEVIRLLTSLDERQRTIFKHIERIDNHLEKLNGNVAIHEKELTIICINRKKAKRMANTFRAHIENMIIGVTDGFEYQLKICSGHFPMNVSKEGNKIVIKNFLGEKVPREANILDGVEANIEQEVITIKGISIESVGQTAANLEQSTKIKNRDRRRFQDGIFITSKRSVAV